VAARAPSLATVSLPIPPTFNRSVTVKHYNTGDFILNSPPYVIKADAPITEYRGKWGGSQPASVEHRWTVEISLAPGTKVLNAYMQAKDGYDANLNPDDSLFERFERKSFSWGKAVCYFSQGGQDASIYVPNNGHLGYHVWGVTKDQQHTVHGYFSVSHPKLATWGSAVRSVKDRQMLEKDPDYLLVEKCPPGEFRPSLTEIGAFMDSLKVK
jgi:hypothetical protein